MEFRILLEPDLDDGGYVAHCPTLPGCHSQGDSREEAISNVRGAIEAYIGSLRKDGLPIPSDVDPDFRFGHGTLPPGQVAAP